MSKVIVLAGIAVVLILILGGAGAYYLMLPAQTSKPVTVPPLVPKTQNTTNTQNNGLQPANPVSLAPVSTNQIALTITNPVDKAVVVTPNVKLTGQTVPNADVSVNDKDLTADAKGAFSTNLTLDEGDNSLDVVAVDADGNVSEQEITITYQAPGS